MTSPAPAPAGGSGGLPAPRACPDGILPGRGGHIEAWQDVFTAIARLWQSCREKHGATVSIDGPCAECSRG